MRSIVTEETDTYKDLRSRMRSIWFASLKLFSLHTSEPCLDVRLLGLYKTFHTLESVDAPAKSSWSSLSKQQACRAGLKDGFLVNKSLLTFQWVKSDWDKSQSVKEDLNPLAEVPILHAP